MFSAFPNIKEHATSSYLDLDVVGRVKNRHNSSPIEIISFSTSSACSTQSISVPALPPSGGNPQSQMQWDRNSWNANERNLAISIRARSLLRKAIPTDRESGVMTANPNRTQSMPVPLNASAGSCNSILLIAAFVESNVGCKWFHRRVHFWIAYILESIIPINCHPHRQPHRDETTQWNQIEQKDLQRRIIPNNNQYNRPPFHLRPRIPLIILQRNVAIILFIPYLLTSLEQIGRGGIHRPSHALSKPDYLLIVMQQSISEVSIYSQ